MNNVNNKKNKIQEDLLSLCDSPQKTLKCRSQMKMANVIIDRGDRDSTVFYPWL